MDSMATEEMTTATEALPQAAPGPVPNATAALTESHTILSKELRRLTRVATLVALLATPSVFYWFHHHEGWSVGKSIFWTFASVLILRGLVDLLIRRAIPWPSLFGTDDARLREEDVVNRRRAWTWRWFFRLIVFVGGLITIAFLWQLWRAPAGADITWLGTLESFGHHARGLFKAGNLALLVQVFFLFIANFLIFMGPLLMMGISQIRGYEPGDAEWGVKLDDVRGQAEAKEEIRRVVTLWQSGEVFEKAGGKRERGLLFLGAPGTGKTMMAKAIATGFNSPFVSIPGSGFAQTFIGIDAIIVRFLRARRRSSPASGAASASSSSTRSTPSGCAAVRSAANDDETPDQVWQQRVLRAVRRDQPERRRDLRDRGVARLDVRAARPEPRAAVSGAGPASINNIVNQGVFPGMMGGMGGGLALNQLLVTMDGIDNPPFFRRVFTNKDQLVPRRDLRRAPPSRQGAGAGFSAPSLMVGGAWLLVNTRMDLAGATAIVPALDFDDRLGHRAGPDRGVAHLPRSRLWRGASSAGTVLAAPAASPPTGDQIYFIGATNVPLENLDPALTRPGRMGRHVKFRTPTKEDRKDIFDLYLGKVAHDPDARHTRAPRRDRADHERLLAGDDRPDLLDGADERPPRGQGGVQLERPRRRDDRDRVGLRDQRARTTRQTRARSRSTRPDTPRQLTSIGPTSSRAGSRSRCAAGSLGHHQSFEKEERFGQFQSTMFGAAGCTSSGRWPPSSPSTARTRTASAATSSRRPG